MPWTDDDKILEVRIGYVANDQQCYNVLHYYINESGSVDDSALELEEDVVTFLSAAGDDPGSLIYCMRDLMSQVAYINTIAAQGIWQHRYRAFTGTVSGFAGLQEDSLPAQNVAAVIEKYGADADRRSIGSFHLGGLSESMYSAGSFTAGAVVKLEALATAIEANLTVPGSDPLNPVTYSPVILNRTKVVIDGKNTWPITGYKELAGTTVKDTVRVMRRRTKGVGI